QDVALRERPAHALYPPIVAALREYVPAIKGIAPELAGTAESVWRHTTHNFGTELLIEAEDGAMRPHVCTIEVHENRDVAKNANAATPRFRTQRAPLFEEGELDRAFDVEFFRQLGACLLKRFDVAPGQLMRPLIPWTS